ncbi:unnamed protein product [Vitrella brassicaformis CCMP3155]|uniref:Uncharacterized protein n=1 Tax=Vitrella brassicaformis (strain CCMP3155) TaxID=1169540 RepID=A0A0G4FD15_VITBC|nr:unnamed protein product [Vitrella brassicaformis CCMP3155]|eukprot:CEM10733.1 unnamed protein product [Vitrella brassicaformis CCMP3155]
MAGMFSFFFSPSKKAICLPSDSGVDGPEGRDLSPSKPSDALEHQHNDHDGSSSDRPQAPPKPRPTGQAHSAPPRHTQHHEQEQSFHAKQRRRKNVKAFRYDQGRALGGEPEQTFTPCKQSGTFIFFNWDGVLSHPEGIADADAAATAARRLDGAMCRILCGAGRAGKVVAVTNLSERAWDKSVLRHFPEMHRVVDECGIDVVHASVRKRQWRHPDLWKALVVGEEIRMFPRGRFMTLIGVGDDLTDIDAVRHVTTFLDYMSGRTVKFASSQLTAMLIKQLEALESLFAEVVRPDTDKTSWNMETILRDDPANRALVSEHDRLTLESFGISMPDMDLQLQVISPPVAPPVAPANTAPPRNTNTAMPPPDQSGDQHPHPHRQQQQQQPRSQETSDEESIPAKGMRRLSINSKKRKTGAGGLMGKIMGGRGHPRQSVAPPRVSGVARGRANRKARREHQLTPQRRPLASMIEHPSSNKRKSDDISPDTAGGGGRGGGGGPGQEDHHNNTNNTSSSSSGMDICLPSPPSLRESDDEQQQQQQQSPVAPPSVGRGPGPPAKRSTGYLREGQRERQKQGAARASLQDGVGLGRGAKAKGRETRL